MNPNHQSVIVSVIIPVFNRADLVKKAIESALAEAVHVPLEVVVVDDASTDDTWPALQNLAAHPSVRLARMERNGGQSAARNRGLELAGGRFVKFLDSDDVLRPGHLAAEVSALDGTADLAVSGWDEERADGSFTTFEAPSFREVVDEVLAGRAVPTSAGLYRRRSAVRWDPSLRKLDDWDFFCQSALGAREIVSVPGPAYLLRHHAGPRATDATMLANAREHHAILGKIERRLEREGTLTTPRRRRLAQYYYKELRVLSLHDPSAFEKAWQHISTLDPSFTPREEERQLFMRVLARVMGTRNAVRLHTFVKRAVRRGA